MDKHFADKRKRNGEESAFFSLFSKTSSCVEHSRPQISDWTSPSTALRWVKGSPVKTPSASCFSLPWHHCMSPDWSVLCKKYEGLLIFTLAAAARLPACLPLRGHSNVLVRIHLFPAGGVQRNNPDPLLLLWTEEFHSSQEKLKLYSSSLHFKYHLFVPIHEEF